jgi:hypothetical protein
MTKPADKFDKIVEAYIKYVPYFGVTFIVLVLAFYIYPRGGYSIGTNPAFWGAFGDYVGGILNPIFGFITLLGLVITVGLQKQILDVQKQELAETKNELAKSAIALEIQNKTMLTQSFENIFFQMLSKQTNLLDKLYFSGHAGLPSSSGIDAAINLAHAMTASMRKTPDHINAYEYLYKRDNVTLGPYFRNLFHTLKLIDESLVLSEEEKLKYSSLARAQLTSAELTLIFYNCLTSYGVGLRPYVIKYRLLKHIDPAQLYSSDWIENSSFYPPETFQARN